MSDWSLDLGGMVLRGVADEDPFRLPREMLFPRTDLSLLTRAAALDALSVEVETDSILLRVQVFVIESGGRTIVVDGGVGDGKERPARSSWHRRRTDFLERLGVAPEDVDAMLFTHLHADHVGWATRWRDDRWVPTFPKARYVVAEREFAHWAALDAVAPVGHGSFRDSVLPVAEAGLLDQVPHDHVPFPGMQFRPLPGHTPGQVGITLTGTKRTVLIAADAVHHPAQLLLPQVVSRFCSDADQAVATRMALLAEAADEGLALVPHHARGRVLWNVKRDGDVFGLRDE
ncbi:MBL fold metallo-hydrolase [Falsiroseomonas sp.]|jgi:glyoxylase-like metal-dependent hydrolase (beta-lactamase superfamily II)|uniref:MBL fold metallo-hydrolase n=1 Tax=Falsiroseomonas sp. TaxID=2870721 RepID=UPI003F6F187D